MTNTENTSWALDTITAVAEDLEREQRAAESRLVAVVAQARRDGATWQQIADRLGTSRQAAQQRFKG